ncbi:hypothetical protein LTR84_000120 [Exophiala bonariae]|uniref:Uncharacterized protein n=1 Tax=Exophiala bonariae TaxID=1690606 RepID=A0AAV9NQ35_9EURO|nr:hypothetical protein LTR84_000120 [Exophiala bonariae]
MAMKGPIWRHTSRRLIGNQEERRRGNQPVEGAPSDREVGIDDGEVDAKSTTADEAVVLTVAESDDANWESSSDAEDVLESAMVVRSRRGS